MGKHFKLAGSWQDDLPIAPGSRGRSEKLLPDWIQTVDSEASLGQDTSIDPAPNRTLYE